MYSFLEAGNFLGKNIEKGTFGYWFSNIFENTWLNFVGAQSIVIAVKESKDMYCFFTGKKTAKRESLLKYDVPISEEGMKHKYAKYYLKNTRPKYHAKYIMNPPIKQSVLEICEYSGEQYESDSLFEDYGFLKKVSPEMLKNFDVNIELSNKYIQPIWRQRKQ